MCVCVRTQRDHTIAYTRGNPSSLGEPAEVTGSAFLVLGLYPDNTKSPRGTTEVNTHVFTVNKPAFSGHNELILRPKTIPPIRMNLFMQSVKSVPVSLIITLSPALDIPLLQGYTCPDHLPPPTCAWYLGNIPKLVSVSTKQTFSVLDLDPDHQLTFSDKVKPECQVNQLGVGEEQTQTLIVIS